VPPPSVLRTKDQVPSSALSLTKLPARVLLCLSTGSDLSQLWKALRTDADLKWKLPVPLRNALQTAFSLEIPDNNNLRVLISQCDVMLASSHLGIDPVDVRRPSVTCDH